MKAAVLDKIASVTLNCRLSREVRLAREIVCSEGSVLAVRVLNRKSTYDQLELTTGRFSRLKPGDVIAGALGRRMALCGYAGHVPESLEPGGQINVLNLGGVLGVVDSANPDVGRPFTCEVLGQVLHFPYVGERVGVPAHIAQGLPDLDRELGGTVPVVAVVGTCMSSGKTHACTALIQELVRRGLRVAAAKATGVSLRRDILAMEDAGASRTLCFTDLGVVTTTRETAPAVTRTLLNRLAAASPDVVVLEMGDGLMGAYGVDAILEEADVREALASVLLCAGDPVGAWGGLRTLEDRYGLKATAVTGPATDNAAGSVLIRDRFGVPAANARVEPEQLAGLVLPRLEARKDA